MILSSTSTTRRLESTQNESVTREKDDPETYLNVFFFISNRFTDDDVAWLHTVHEFIGIGQTVTPQLNLTSCSDTIEKKNREQKDWQTEEKT